MKKLLKKLLLSVLLQCIYIFCFLQVALMYRFYVIDWEIDWWILGVIFLVFNIFIQRLIYKIYKTNPLENEKYNDIYMGVNGIFIVFEVYLFL